MPRRPNIISIGGEPPRHGAAKTAQAASDYECAGCHVNSSVRIALRLHKELVIHPRRHALTFQGVFKFAQYIGVFLVIGDGGAAFFQINRAKRAC